MARFNQRWLDLANQLIQSIDGDVIQATNNNACIIPQNMNNAVSEVDMPSRRMTPKMTRSAMKQTVEGKPQTEIAKSLGVSQSTISKNLSVPEIKQRIEHEIALLMDEGLPPARKTLCKFATMGTDENITDDKDMAKLALDASKTILSHAQGHPGTVVNALIQINNAPEQAEELKNISEFLKHMWEKDVVDASPQH